MPAAHHCQMYYRWVYNQPHGWRGLGVEVGSEIADQLLGHLSEMTVWNGSSVRPSIRLLIILFFLSFHITWPLSWNFANDTWYYTLMGTVAQSRSVVSYAIELELGRMILDISPHNRFEPYFSISSRWGRAYWNLKSIQSLEYLSDWVINLHNDYEQDFLVAGRDSEFQSICGRHSRSCTTVKFFPTVKVKVKVTWVRNLWNMAPCQIVDIDMVIENE